MMNTTRYLAKCKACGCHTSALSEGHDARRRKADLPAGSVYTNAWGFIALDCRKCGKELKAKGVVGKFSAKHVCNAKCLESKGFTCECSCAGKNHGAGHSA